MSDTIDVRKALALASLPLRITLPHDEPDPRERYSLSDPDRLAEAWGRLYRARYYGEGEMRPEDVGIVLMMAQDYLELAGVGECEIGQEAAVEKVRDLHRARRARAVRRG